MLAEIIVKGKGLARDCETNGGSKGLFSDYIANLWQKINLSPSNSSALELETENNLDI